MAGEEQHALALRIGEPHALVALVFGAREHLFRRQRAEGEELQQHLAEVHERRARDGAPHAGGLVRETLLQVRQRHAPMRAIERIEHQAQRRAPGAHDSVGHARRHGAHGDDRPVLDRLLHPSTAFTDSNSACGRIEFNVERHAIQRERWRQRLETNRVLVGREHGARANLCHLRCNGIEVFLRITMMIGERHRRRRHSIRRHGAIERIAPDGRSPRPQEPPDP